MWDKRIINKTSGQDCPVERRGDTWRAVNTQPPSLPAVLIRASPRRQQLGYFG
jgi:hypothetical protein